MTDFASASNVADLRWSAVNVTTGPTPIARHGHRAVCIKDLIITYGGGNEGIFDDLFVFSTTTNTWFRTELRSQKLPALAAFGMCCDGRNIYIYGGMINNNEYNSEIYMIDTHRWDCQLFRTRPPANGLSNPIARFGHSLNLDSDGMLYVFGGLAMDSEENGYQPLYLNDFWRINIGVQPAQWERLDTANGPSPRESHTGVIYEANGAKQLIIYGGMNGDRLNDMYICDLNTLAWREIEQKGIVPLGRSLHTANVLNGKMYVFGGWVPSMGELIDSRSIKPMSKCSKDLACFNIVKETWEPVTELVSEASGEEPRARAGHAATVVNSRIYIWSGRDGARKIANSPLCCNDMFYLETQLPRAPESIQLIKAHPTTLEITWPIVSNAISYVVEVQKCKAEEKPQSDNPAKPAPLTRVAPPTKQPNSPYLPPSRPVTEQMPTNFLEDSEPSEGGASPSKSEPKSEEPMATGSGVEDTTKEEPKDEIDTVNGLSEAHGSEGNLTNGHSDDTKLNDLSEIWHEVAVVDKPPLNVTHYSGEDSSKSKVALKPGTTYRLRIASRNICGQGPYYEQDPETGTFKTPAPGFPGAPSSIRISKGVDCALLTWEPPAVPNGAISEYSVYLAVRNSNSTFLRVYAGSVPTCSVPNNVLKTALVDHTPKPAVIFRIAAKNEKGYGPATQVRWLQDQKPGQIRMANPQSVQTTPIGSMAKRIRLE